MCIASYKKKDDENYYNPMLIVVAMCHTPSPNAR
jgi:hypothetical protein